MSSDSEKTDRRFVDFQILLSAKQLHLALEQQGLTQKSCMQAALLQLFKALEAYLSEITERRVQSFEQFRDFEGGDFRVTQLRELVNQPDSWINGLQTMVKSTGYIGGQQSTLEGRLPEPTGGIIASSVQPEPHWSVMEWKELESFHTLFAEVVSAQRQLAWEQ